jgi:exodeoxyribonuclease VII small subunit
LENGETRLEEAVHAFERGTLLKQHCEKQLAAAQLKINKIQEQADGSVGYVPLDP